MKLIDRTGETKISKGGNLMTIINYTNARNIDVLFPDTGYIAINRDYKEFSVGILKDMYEKTVWGVGYLGGGKHKSGSSKKTCNLETHVGKML